MSARLYSKALPFLSIPLILAYYFSWISFVALVPLFFFFENKQYIKPIILTFLPFLLFIYSGIYKGTHTYYGLFFAISIFLVLLLSLYHLLYIILGSWLFKKSNLPLPFFTLFFVSSEFLKDKLFYGMPLGNLNILTYNLPFFIRDASIFGSLYIDFKIIIVNLALYYILRKNIKTALILIFPIFIISLIPYLPNKKPVKQFRASMDIVQGNIPQNQKWEEQYLERNLEKYLNLSNGLKANIVIWPESAYPYLFDPRTSISIKNLIDNNTFALLFGALTKQNDNYYNSVVFYTKKHIEFYNKRQLVPFAEFIPLAKFLGLEEYNFSRGKMGVIFKYKNLKIAPLICYEENFTYLSRQYKMSGANLIVVFTNDAWFDKTPTFSLFPRSDVYRSVENRIWLARSANTGISFVINPEGKIFKEIKPDSTSILKEDLNLTVYKPTFYDKFGWMFGYIITAISILLLFYKKRKNRTT